MFSIPERKRLVEFCLSFSRFSSQDWKRKSIEIGEGILTSDLGDPLLVARLSLRKRELLYLFPSRTIESPHPAEDKIISIDACSNAFLGEKMVLEVQRLIGHGQLSLALTKLEEFNFAPQNRSSPSKLEQDVVDSIKLFKSKIYRFSNRFALAKDLLSELLGTKCARIQPVVSSHMIAVYCELGEIS
ncbi:hypothetical protein B7494_g5197 [Chlorociboria aeruginascens]|nr:hypothetical protein B7494_g5197 [Chlorociboria aeruginascens]